MFLQDGNIYTRILSDWTKIKDATWESIANIIVSIIERLRERKILLGIGIRREEAGAR